MFKSLLRIILALALTCVGGAAFAQDAASAPAAAVMPAAPVAGAPVANTNPNYVLGAGDRIRVIVFGEATLSGEFFVSPQGSVSYPLIGDIHAAGRSLPQFQTDIAARLKEGYVNEPRVSVEVLNYRPFYILGEVTRPGTYPFSSDMSVMNAVATAGGFTYRANKGTVFIKRLGSTKEDKVKLRPDTMVEPGDTVRIGERIF